MSGKRPESTELPRHLLIYINVLVGLLTFANEAVADWSSLAGVVLVANSYER